ncbi:MAG: hypothetical protein ABIQ65_01870 [Thermoanaerobaculia bacterium]
MSTESSAASAVVETGVGLSGVLITPGGHRLGLPPESRWVKIGLFMSLISLSALAACARPRFNGPATA